MAVAAAPHHQQHRRRSVMTKTGCRQRQGRHRVDHSLITIGLLFLMSNAYFYADYSISAVAMVHVQPSQRAATDPAVMVNNRSTVLPLGISSAETLLDDFIRNSRETHEAALSSVEEKKKVSDKINLMHVEFTKYLWSKLKDGEPICEEYIDEQYEPHPPSQSDGSGDEKHANVATTPSTIRKQDASDSKDRSSLRQEKKLHVDADQQEIRTKQFFDRFGKVTKDGRRVFHNKHNSLLSYQFPIGLTPENSCSRPIALRRAGSLVPFSKIRQLRESPVSRGIPS